MIDVAIPLLSVNASGGVRMVLRVANALAARGVGVAISAPAGENPVSLDERVRILARDPGRHAFVTSLPPARVYVATGYQTPLLIAAARLVSAPHARMVYLIQNDEPVSHITLGRQPAFLKPALHAVARVGYRIPATRIAVSRYVAKRVGKQRIHRVIAPGIEPRFLESARGRKEGDALTVGVLSHPGRVKGLRFALEAFSALRGDPSFRFVAFDGANPAPLPDFVTPFSRVAAERGIRHDIAEFYRACDVFVFPSLIEGFGLPPLEAMGCGTAVVLTDSGGVREYALSGENCLMVPPASPEELAAAVRTLQDAALRARLVMGGRATAHRFPVEYFAEACADTIQSVLRGAPNK